MLTEKTGAFPLRIMRARSLFLSPQPPYDTNIYLNKLPNISV